MKKIVLCVLMALLICFFVGCGQKSSQEVTVIKGATASAIAEDLFQRYDIVTKEDKNGSLIGSHIDKDNKITYEVQIDTANNRDVKAITYTIRGNDGAEENYFLTEAVDWLGYAASSPFTGVDTAAAREWAEIETYSATGDSVEEEHFGSLNYRLSGDDGLMRQLVIMPAKDSSTKNEPKD